MNIRDMIYISLFAAMMAVLGLIPSIHVPLIPVPITAQTLGVMLAGSLLGAKRGTLSMLLFMIIVLAGAPLLSGGRGGLAVLVGPTVGYFISWPIATIVIGLLVQKLKTQTHFWKLLVINFIGGIIVIYAFGSVLLSFITELPLLESIAGNVAFLPGDMIKVILASIIAARVLKVYPLRK